MIWLAEARGRLSALSGVIRNCTHKNQDTPGKLVGNKLERFGLILYSCIWRWFEFTSEILLRNLPWCWSPRGLVLLHPPATFWITWRVWEHQGYVLGGLGLGCGFFGDCRVELVGRVGQGCTVWGSPFSLPRCPTCDNVWGREVGTARLPCPPSSSSCACTTFATSPRSTVSTSDTLFDTLLASLCINKASSKFTLGQLDFRPLSRVSHWQPITVHFTHLSAVCWLFWVCTDIHLGNCINRSAKIVINVNKSNRCTATLAEYVTKHCRFAQIHNIVDRIMLLTWLRFTKY